MHITQRQLDDLNVVLTISITKEDYKNQVEASLYKQKKNLQLHGFRKGQVPMSLIRKQYESALMVEEIRHFLQRSLHDYISQEKLNLLGDVLPKRKEQLDLDAEELSFEFELALRPQFDVDLDRLELTCYEITVSDEEVDQCIAKLRESFGKFEAKESVGEIDRIHGKIEALSSHEGSQKPWHKYHTFAVEKLSQEVRSRCLGAKVGASFCTNTAELFPEIEEWAYIMEGEATEHFPVQYTIEKIFYIQPAEVNQTLFDKAYGQEAIESEEEFRAKVKTECSKMYTAKSDMVLFDSAMRQLARNTKFDLPEFFLQRWIRQQYPHFSDEQVQKEYEKVEKGFRFQLIENKLAEKFNIRVTQEDLRQKVRSILQAQWTLYGQGALDEALLEQFVVKTLRRAEEVRHVSAQVFRDHLLRVLKEQLPLKNQICSWTEFIQELGQKNLDSQKDP